MMDDLIEINMFIKGLPFELKKDLKESFMINWKEIQYLILNKKIILNKEIQNDHIRLLLAIVIFKKKIIDNLGAAINFYNGISNLYSDFKEIQIGKFSFNNEEFTNILKIVNEFEKIIFQFQIYENFFEYENIYDFLKKIEELYYYQKNERK